MDQPVTHKLSNGNSAPPIRNTNIIIPGLVSTIIPVCNRPELIIEAVTSVLSQTYGLLEVIIVDDGSTDDTGLLCDQLAKEHSIIRVIHQAHDGRPGLAREAGRTVASGEYIQYLDSDDLLLPKKFEVMVRALEDTPDCDIAYCYARRYYRGQIPQDIPCELTGVTFQTMLPSFLQRRYWLTSVPLYRRRICDKVGPWSDLLSYEDVEYDMRFAAMNPKLYHCKEFLTEIRDHEFDRLSPSNFWEDAESVRQVPRAFKLIYQHARNYGITYEDENMQVFIEEALWIGNRCSELELHKEAQECYRIVNDATGEMPLVAAGDSMSSVLGQCRAS